MRNVLGLDLGTNSIGWCLIQQNDDKRPVAIVDSGVRIFQEAVDAKTRTPKNHARRAARMQRRVIQRRCRRKARLRNFCIHLGWLPKSLRDRADPEAWFNSLGDPYELRRKGLSELLEPAEFARVQFHLCSRRGFLSNRKTTLMDLYRSGDPDVVALLRESAEDQDDEFIDKESKAEETEFKQAVSELRNAIVESGARTIGEFLAQKPLHARKRGFRVDRAMIEAEFNALWNTQSQLDPETYTDEIRLRCREIIFFQRPLKLKKNRRGRCSIEPGRYRALKASLEAQEFRLLQDVNHIRIIDTQMGEYVRPGREAREALVGALQTQSTMTWSKAKKLLGVPSRAKINLQESKSSLVGNRTAAKLRGIDPEFWQSVVDSGKEHAFVEDLMTIKNRYDLYRRLVSHWSLGRESALAFASAELEPGMAHLSRKAITRMLPFLRSGKIFSDARVAAGYGYDPKQRALSSRLGEPPIVRNPVVEKALHEVRKLVNAIIRAHGKPSAVRLEMARDMKLSSRQKAAIKKQNRINQRENDEAKQQFQAVRDANPHLRLNETPSRGDFQRYRLWKETTGLCVYSGKEISLTELWSADVEVDHILPYSRSLDDSYMNKVVCRTEANRRKGNRLPSEAWTGDAWLGIVARAGALPRPKSNRLLRASLDKIDDFIARQLNDTRYISRETLKFLSTTFSDVSVSTGASTALFRRQWGLNQLLGSSGEKNRADHRHHFIDAVVVALTDRAAYQKLSNAASKAEGMGDFHAGRLSLSPPIGGLREDVAGHLDRMIVSHATNRRVSGALHEDTFRSALHDGAIAKRITVDQNVKLSDLKKVVDPVLRQRLLDHVKRCSNDTKRAFAQPFDIGGGRFLRHVKIQTAKPPKPGTYVELKDPTGSIQRRANFGNIHHVEVIRDDSGKVRHRFVTLFEAAARAKPKSGVLKRPVVDRTTPESGQFLFALHINDTVAIDNEGQPQFYRVQKLERDTGRLTLRIHHASRIDVKAEGIRKSISQLVQKDGLRPVLVNTLGKATNS